MNSKKSILHNLYNREVNGLNLNSIRNPFGKSVPQRLNIPIESIVPSGALQNGHIFIGFSNCGRFLFSYTTRQELGNAYSRNEMISYYKLHIWLFTPYKLSKRIGSTILFSNNGVADNNLLINITEWNGDETMLLIVGRHCSPEAGGCKTLCYVTVTSLPSTGSCSDCSNVERYADFGQACDDEEETLYYKTRCLRHCLTLHLAFELVPPFPEFQFDVQLKKRDTFVINTGNSIHVFTLNITKPLTESKLNTELLKPPIHHEPNEFRTRLLYCNFWLKTPIANCRDKILNNCSVRETFKLLQGSKSQEQSLCNYNRDLEKLLSRIPLNMETKDNSSQKSHNRRLSKSSLDSSLSSLSQLTSLSEFSSILGDLRDMEAKEPSPSLSPPRRIQPCVGNTVLHNTMPPPPRRKFFKTGLTSQRMSSRTNTLDQASSVTIGNTYDVFDVVNEDVLTELSLSSYRRKRNADKKYEFSDTDISSENIIPMKIPRERRIIATGQRSPGNLYGGTEQSRTEAFTQAPRSPRAYFVHSPMPSPNHIDLNDILRPLSNNSIENSPLHPLMSPPTFRDHPAEEYSNDSTPNKFSPLSPSGIDLFAKNSNKSESCSKPTFTTRINCIAKILRSYVDKDDGTSSVHADNDDEYDSTIPFPVAVNMEFHGSHYQSLQLIKNGKVKFSPIPVVEALQRTLEVEILCNEVAGLICLLMDKAFISCLDYDVAIVDVCSETGTLDAVGVILMQATKKQDLENGDEYCDIDLETCKEQNERGKYEAAFSFSWDPIEEKCEVLYLGHFRQITNTTSDIWHPTKKILHKHGNELLGRFSSVKQRVLTNDLAVYEWKPLDELSDSSGLITIYSSCNSVSSRERFDGSSVSFGFSNPDDTEDDELSD